MKPLKVEPKDIAIILEISVTELTDVVNFIEKLLPLSYKLFTEEDSSNDNVKDFVSVAKEILDHPLVKGR